MLPTARLQAHSDVHEQHPSHHSQPRPSLPQVIRSVAAAFFGVQSSENRRRDFTYGKPLHFLVVGVLMTGVVALTFYGVVHLALRFAGV